MLVNLTPPPWAAHLISDLTDWRRRPLPIGRLVPFEYAYLDAAGRPRPDPDNPHPAANPWWPHARSLYGPLYRPGLFAEAGGTAPAGRTLRLTLPSRHLGQSRRILVYSPAGLAEAALPLVYIQDGGAYYHWGKTPLIVDRLLAARRLQPAHFIFITPRDREREYAFSAAYERFFSDELLPGVESRVRGAGLRIAMGASLGGLASAWLAWRRPDLFGTVASQSGAFLFSPADDSADPFTGSEWLLERIRRDPKPALRWCLDCGTLEWLLPAHRRLFAAMRERGYELHYRERHAGHNWVNWRDGLAALLQDALGRP
jgi:enterochelin esterase-like enzyme